MSPTEGSEGQRQPDEGDVGQAGEAEEDAGAGTATVPSQDQEGYITLWDFAGSQRSLASRILCFICLNDYGNVFIPEKEHKRLLDEHNDGAGNRDLLMRWSISSEYVDRIARVLIVQKQHLMDFLTTQRFNQSQMYNPAAGLRDRWFRTWRHSLPAEALPPESWEN